MPREARLIYVRICTRLTKYSELRSMLRRSLASGVYASWYAFPSGIPMRPHCALHVPGLNLVFQFNPIEEADLCLKAEHDLRARHMRTNNIGIMAHVVAACLLSNRDSCVGPCYGPCFCVLVLALNQISVVTDSKRPPNMGNPALLYCPNFDVVDRKVGSAG